MEEMSLCSAELSEYADCSSAFPKDGRDDTSPESRLRPIDQTATAPEHDKEQFYDCAEFLGAPDTLEKDEVGREGSGDGTGRSETADKQKTHSNFGTLTGDRESPFLLDEATEECEEAGGRFEEDQSHEHMDDSEQLAQHLDAELKVEEGVAPEFDDEYLKELEESLTEEEKENRRQEAVALKDKGNELFKSGEYTEADDVYTSALRTCPICHSKERAVLFSNRAAARLHLDLKEKAIADCTKAIELNPDYLKAILRRAELYEKTDKLDEALEDYKNILEKSPENHIARQACMRLPAQIEERNEKLKQEMMSKLKDLGNMFLRPFGLSTNNFQLNQDTNTGSYSINFVQKPDNR